MSGQPSGTKRLELGLRDAQAALARHVGKIKRAESPDVHEARIAARRLRSVLKTFGPLFDDEAVERYRGGLAETARLLADLRTLDVIGELAPLERQPFAAALRADRVRAHRNLQRRLRQPSFARMMDSVATPPSAAALGLEQRIESDVLLRRVRRGWRRSLRRIEERPRTGEALHKLRIELKHARYSLDLVRDIEPEKSEVLHRQLRNAQKVLGDLRDAEAAIAWLDGPSAQGLDERAVARARTALRRRGQRQRRALGPKLKKLRTAGQRWDDAVTKVIRRASRDRSSPSPGRRN